MGEREPVISVRDLDFRYPGDPRPVLRGLTMRLDRGDRCLLVGANGAGKTTLLRVLAGKHMVAEEAVHVLGRPAFHDTSLAARVEYLGGAFPFEVDVPVGALLSAAPPAPAARRQQLVSLLGVDPDWHMHRISDGQRRRVQILLGLMSAPEVLLLDEITTDLDLVARRDLLDFLRRDSESRGATVVYATHILGRLDEWATHLAYLVGGRTAVLAPLAEIPELAAARATGSSAPLPQLVESWLRRDAGRA